MIVVRIGSGLANQIYQYMAGYALAKELGQELYLDISLCENGAIRGFLLNIFKKLHYEGLISYTLKNNDGRLSNLKNINSELLEGKWVLLDDLLVDSQDLNYLNGEFYKGLDSSFQREKNDYYLAGWWLKNKEGFWKKYENEIRKLLLLKDDSFYSLFKEKMESNSVGIHIRRGDFKYVDYTMLEGEFFRAAIQYYRNHYRNCKFYVFTNDLKWAEEELGKDSSIYYISSFGGIYGDVIEFACLSLCKYKILSEGSTFSNLAFWLNQENEKIAVRNVTTSIEQQSLLLKVKVKIYEYLQLKSTLFRKMKGIDTIFLNRSQVTKLVRKYKRNEKDNIEDRRQLLNLIFSKNLDAKQVLECINQIGMNVYGISNSVYNQLMFRKFVTLIQLEEYDKADVIGHKIWSLFEDSEEFHYYYALELVALGRNKEAAIELSRIWGENITENKQNMVKGWTIEEIKLLELFSKKEKFNFIIIPYDEVRPDVRIDGIVMIGVLLRRLGHEVNFVFKGGKGYKNYLDDYETLVDADKTDYACKQFAWESLEEKDVLSNLLLKLCKKGQKNIILTRDAIGNLEKYDAKTFFWDFKDQRDIEAESGKRMPKEKLYDLYQSVDYILTIEPIKDFYNCLIYDEKFLAKSHEYEVQLKKEYSVSEIYTVKEWYFKFIKKLLEKCRTFL